MVWRDRTPGVHLAAVRRTATLTDLAHEGTARLTDHHAAASFRRDRDDRTFRSPDLRV